MARNKPKKAKKVAKKKPPTEGHKARTAAKKKKKDGKQKYANEMAVVVHDTLLSTCVGDNFDSEDTWELTSLIVKAIVGVSPTYPKLEAVLEVRVEVENAFTAEDVLQRFADDDLVQDIQSEHQVSLLKVIDVDTGKEKAL
jgi:hypothetical protein